MAVPPLKLIVMEIAKQELPFSQADIVRATGMSQQLVSHHMRKLVNEGFIIRGHGGKAKYAVSKRGELVDMLTSIVDRRVYQKPEYKHIKAAGQRKIELIRAMRGLNMKGATDAQEELLAIWSELIAELEAARKYLLHSTPSEPKAREFMRGYENDVMMWNFAWTEFESIQALFGSEYAFNNYCIEERELEK